MQLDAWNSGPVSRLANWRAFTQAGTRRAARNIGRLTQENRHSLGHLQPHPEGKPNGIPLLRGPDRAVARALFKLRDSSGVASDRLSESQSRGADQELRLHCPVLSQAAFEPILANINWIISRSFRTLTGLNEISRQLRIQSQRLRSRSEFFRASSI